ncbi:MAG: hypothetical protein LH613_06290 [Chamaesiphon sp.]|nr:hypothetical protein [Chamaesiphon sp.]
MSQLNSTRSLVKGRAERLTDRSEIERVTKLIKEQNPTLTPAINRTWIDAWGHADVVMDILRNKEYGLKTQFLIPYS